MKRLIQSYRKGDLTLANVPIPAVGSGNVLVQTRASLVSTGTERYMVDLARKSLLGKALARPDLASKVIQLARKEGIMEAWQQAMGRLDEPVLLGYSSTGVVIDVGSRVQNLRVGDRVACTGSGYAGHGEVVSVPENLCTVLPADVDFAEGSFCALGGIALEAIRMSHAELGHRVAVIGLGLIGQICVQLLVAAGCTVIGFDVNKARAAAMAASSSAVVASADADEFKRLCSEHSGGHGADATIIFAATTSNDPLNLAAEATRERGRVVAAGLTGLDVPRKTFYEKELELVVSRGWGAGLYDGQYIAGNANYPVAYARWTAERNVGAFLDLLARKSVDVSQLISHEFAFDKAVDAYEMILSGSEPVMGVVLNYPVPTGEDAVRSGVSARVAISATASGEPVAEGSAASGKVVKVSLIGAGQYARGTLLPALASREGVSLHGIASSTGIAAQQTGEKYGFSYCTNSSDEILADDKADAAFVLTRHGSHASLTAQAVGLGKAVFVEKPLALTEDQLLSVAEAIGNASVRRPVMVGFNRRFAPLTRWMKSKFDGVEEPLAVHMTVNAGRLPPDSWVYDPVQGGGRILGELCHFVDLAQFLVGSHVVRVNAETLNHAASDPSDNVSVTLAFANGGIASISYFAGGDKGHPRERCEIFGGDAVGVIDDFRSAEFTKMGKTEKNRLRSTDRGHQAAIQAFLDAVRTGGDPIPVQDLLNSTAATIAADRSCRERGPVNVLTEDLHG